MELEEQVEPARGGGDVLLDDPITIFEFVWDNFADGGYDSTCHPDRCVSNLWADNLFNGSSLFVPKTMYSSDISVLTPQGRRSLDVAAPQSRDSLRGCFSTFLSNTFSYLQTTFFEDEEDEFKSVCSTEYFSCYSGSSVELEFPCYLKEQKEVELLFSNFKISLDVCVTPQRNNKGVMNGSTKADDMDLKKNSSCRKWITEQYNGDDSKCIRYSNSSLAVDTGSLISDNSLLDWLHHPFVNVPIKSASDVTVNKSKETCSDEDFDSKIIRSMNNLPTIKGIVSRHFRLVPEDFTFTDQYIDDFYLQGCGKAATSNCDMKSDVVDSLSWLKIYPSNMKCPIVDLSSGEMSMLEQCLSPSPGDGNQSRSETNESVSKIFDETVDYQELPSTSTSQENELFPTDTFEKLAMVCGKKSIDSSVRLSDMLLDNDQQSVSIDKLLINTHFSSEKDTALVTAHGSEDLKKHHSRLDPLPLQTVNEESSVVCKMIQNPENTNTENEKYDPFPMCFNEEADYKTVRSLIDVFETSHNEYETFRTSFNRDCKEIDRKESKKHFEFWHNKDNKLISSACEDRFLASDSTHSTSKDDETYIYRELNVSAGHTDRSLESNSVTVQTGNMSEEDQTPAYNEQNVTLEQKDISLGSNNNELEIDNVAKEIAEELMDSAVRIVVQEQMNKSSESFGNVQQNSLSGAMKTSNIEPNIPAALLTKKVHSDHKPVRIDQSAIADKRQQKYSDANKKSEIELKGRKDSLYDIESEDSSSINSQITQVAKTFSKDIIYAARVDIAEERLALEYRRQKAQRLAHLDTLGSASTPQKNETKVEIVHGDSNVCKFGGGQCKCNRCVVQRKQFAVSKIPIRPSTDTNFQKRTYELLSDQCNFALKNSCKTIPKKPSLQIKEQNNKALSKQDRSSTSKCLKKRSKKIEVKDTKKTAFLKERAKKKSACTDKKTSKSQAENAAIARKLSCSVMPNNLLPTAKEKSVQNSVVQSPKCIAPSPDSAIPSLECVVPSLNSVIPSPNSVVPSLDNVVLSVESVVPSVESMVPSHSNVVTSLEKSEACNIHKHHGVTCSLCKRRKTMESC